MVAQLKEVISKVEQLDEEEQKRIAKLLDEEIKRDNRAQKVQEQLTELSEDTLNEKKGKYDEEYLKGLRDKAKKSWLGDVNPDEWLSEMRGGYE